MPFFKGKGKKVDPLGNAMVSQVDQESVTRPGAGEALPYPATLKHQLNHLSVESLDRDDDSEDGVERTAFPARNSGAQSITLPLNMPVFGAPSRRRVQPAFESSPLDHTLRPGRCFLEPILPTSLEDKFVSSGFSAGTAPDGHSDISPCSGKWFNDIDKLSAFKAKYRLRVPKEQIDTEKEWTASPKNFYKSILKLRQQKYLCNKDLHNGHTIMSGLKRDEKANDRRVCFSPQALLFSFIDDNLFRELRDIIKSQEIDVNSCPNARGLTPLHRAVEAGSVKCARVLLENGANVNLKDARGRSVLDSAFRTRHFECLALLVEFGANVEEYTTHRINEFKNARDLSKTCYKSFEATV